MASFAIPQENPRKSRTAFLKPSRSEVRFHALSPLSEERCITRRSAPLLSHASAQSVLEEFTGEIEAVEGGLILLSLCSDGLFFEAELSENVFQPGMPIEPGRGVVARRVQQRDDLVTWSVEILPKKQYSAEELADEQERLEALFGGTGL